MPDASGLAQYGLPWALVGALLTLVGTTLYRARARNGECKAETLVPAIKDLEESNDRLASAVNGLQVLLAKHETKLDQIVRWTERSERRGAK